MQLPHSENIGVFFQERLKQVLAKYFIPHVKRQLVEKLSVFFRNEGGHLVFLPSVLKVCLESCLKSFGKLFFLVEFVDASKEKRECVLLLVGLIVLLDFLNGLTETLYHYRGGHSSEKHEN